MARPTGSETSSGPLGRVSPLHFDPYPQRGGRPERDADYLISLLLPSFSASFLSLLPPSLLSLFDSPFPPSPTHLHAPAAGRRRTLAPASLPPPARAWLHPTPRPSIGSLAGTAASRGRSRDRGGCCCCWAGGRRGVRAAMAGSGGRRRRREDPAVAAPAAAVRRLVEVALRGAQRLPPLPRWWRGGGGGVWFGWHRRGRCWRRRRYRGGAGHPDAGERAVLDLLRFCLEGGGFWGAGADEAAVVVWALLVRIMGQNLRVLSVCMCPFQCSRQNPG